MDPSPWPWQPAVWAAATEGGDENLQGGEHHPTILAETWVPLLVKGCVCGRRWVCHHAAVGRVCLCSPALHTQSSPPVPSSPPQSENAHTYLADKTLLSQETSNMLGPHFHAGEECDLIFSLRPIIWSLPFTPPGHKEDLSLSAKGWVAVCGTPQQDPPLLRPWCPWHSAGLLSPWVLRLLGPRSGLPHDRSPRESRGSAEGAEPPGDSAALAWYQSSAWRSRINQCFGLVFGYYGQYIKGIYLRKCLSCQSFPISSILNTPYNYWYYPGKFSPWSFLH